RREIAMNADRRTPRTALVTGAWRGIGRELARLIAADGCDLVIVGREPSGLEDLAAELRETHGVVVRCEPRDLSEPHSVERLWADLESAGIAVDILVN